MSKPRNIWIKNKEIPHTNTSFSTYVTGFDPKRSDKPDHELIHFCEVLPGRTDSERLKLAESAIRDSWNKMNCFKATCAHKTKAVNGEFCTSHKLMFDFLSVGDAAMDQEDGK